MGRQGRELRGGFTRQGHERWERRESQAEQGRMQEERSGQVKVRAPIQSQMCRQGKTKKEVEKNGKEKQGLVGMARQGNRVTGKRKPRGFRKSRAEEGQPSDG